MKYKLCIKRQSDDSPNNYYECQSCKINIGKYEVSVLYYYFYIFNSADDIRKKYIR